MLLKNTRSLVWLFAGAAVLLGNSAAAQSQTFVTTNNALTRALNGNGETGVTGSKSDCAYTWMTTSGTRSYVHLNSGSGEAQMTLRTKTYFGSRYRDSACWKKWAYNRTVFHEGYIHDVNGYLVARERAAKSNQADWTTKQTKILSRYQLAKPSYYRTYHVAYTKSGVRMVLNTRAYFKQIQ